MATAKAYQPFIIDHFLKKATLKYRIIHVRNWNAVQSPNGVNRHSPTVKYVNTPVLM